MTRRHASPAFLLALTAGSAALGACHPKPMASFGRTGAVHVASVEPTDGPVTIAPRLTCPQASGPWTRTAAAGDGARCSYVSSKGVLDLAFASGPAGDPAATLAPERAWLDTLMPSARNAAVMVDSRTWPDGREVASVDLPFLHVHDDGAHKSVKIMGVSIDKTDSYDHVVADDDVRAKPGSGTKLVYFLAGAETAPGGYHAVGYQARGDASGRLVVASFRLARGGSVYSDGDEDGGIDRLLDLNAPRSGVIAAQP